MKKARRKHRATGLPLNAQTAYSSRRRYGIPYVYYNAASGDYQAVYNSKTPGQSRCSPPSKFYYEAKGMVFAWVIIKKQKGLLHPHYGVY